MSGNVLELTETEMSADMELSIRRLSELNVTVLLVQSETSSVDR